uniref:Uncharacterized protein n=2 Tax=Anguilla anguilla TaxID=7936 RepID=A0A0E9SRY5_ANGAN
MRKCGPLLPECTVWYCVTEYRRGKEREGGGESSCC